MNHPFCLLLICVTLLGSGCKAAVQGPPPSAPPAEQLLLKQASEEHLFRQVIGELAKGRTSPTLLELERLYPQNSTTEHARLLADAFTGMQKQLAQLQRDKSLCQQEKERLGKDYRQLQDDQEKLRKLVVEMERRRR